MKDKNAAPDEGQFVLTIGWTTQDGEHEDSVSTDKLCPSVEVELRNLGRARLEAAYRSHPLALLSFIVVDSNNLPIAETHPGERFAFGMVDRFVCVEPGESYTWSLPLAAILPREMRQPGTYRVIARFLWRDREIKSVPASVTW